MGTYDRPKAAVHKGTRRCAMRGFFAQFYHFERKIEVQVSCVFSATYPFLLHRVYPDLWANIM
jgi:hypothetical protein